MSAALSSPQYQILFLGRDDEDRRNLQLLIEAHLIELGLEPTSVRFIGEQDAHTRDLRAPAMAVFFGSKEHAKDSPVIAELIEESIVVAPIVSSLDNAGEELPPQLRHVNAVERRADASGIVRISTLALELFRLLRSERRLFISYKRLDSRPFAEKLYDALDARGFDVFIDVRSVPPAADFQARLWHRMNDSDVVVLIDTPGFRQSRWTTAELARANATNLQILHLLWPGQPEDSTSAFSHFVKLGRSDFLSLLPMKGRWARRRSVQAICDEVERLRARAIAWRYRYLVDNFCDAARDLGLTPSVQPERWVLVETPKAKPLAVVPTIGIPTSDRINEIFEAISASKPAAVWVIYDSRGVLDSWLSHLSWLDKYLPVRTVQMSKVPKLLSELLA